MATTIALLSGSSAVANDLHLFDPRSKLAHLTGISLEADAEPRR
jgi:hypothetical protein